MRKTEQAEIVLLSSGHLALDHRVFDKEAVTLARYFPHVRVVAAHPADEVRNGVQITALPPVGSRLNRFLIRPLQCFHKAWGPGDRVLILHDAELLVWAPLVRLLTGWRIIYDVHEDFAQLLLRRTWIPASLRRGIGQVIGSLERLLSRRCDGILGATAVLADHFTPQRRQALYNLPSEEFIAVAACQARRLEERTYDVVHLGTLSEERLDFLCALLQELFQRMPTARALVVGVTSAQEALLRRRFALERVTVIGTVGYDRIATLLGDCRIGLDVHPILYPHLRCAVPVKVFEYMAAGCNVVTSYLPELQRLLADEGEEHVMTVYTHAVASFVDEMTRLLQDIPAMTRHQDALMRQVRAQWNWEHEAEKLIRFLSQLHPQKEMITCEQVLDH